MKRMLYVASLVLFTGLATGVVSAKMTISSLNGAVTSTEVSSFKTFMQGESPPTQNTYDNTCADGTPGMECEALGLMYEVTNDPALLNQMVQYADAFLWLRNNTNNGQVMWDGARDPVWLTKATNTATAGYAGCENNDIVGHIAYCAKLILESPALWNTVVPSGDPYTNGATYFQRAQTYIAQMDLTQDAYMLKWFISPLTYQIVAPSSSAWTAEGQSVNAWNRQMMFLNGFQRLSECHQLLGDNPARVTEYNKIVQASVNWFFNASLSGLTTYTSNNAAVYNWDYAPMSGGSEDLSLHSDYDMWGLNRAYLTGIYTNLTASMMTPFGNTLQNVIYKGGNTFAGWVSGDVVDGSRNYIYPAWMMVADLTPTNYFIIANADIAQGSQGSTAIFDAFILWAKNARYAGSFPTNYNGPDFAIVIPWTCTVSSGSNAICTVILNPLSGFTNTVTLSASHLPLGVTASFSVPAITNGSGSVTLTLSAAKITPGGVYVLTNGVIITGTSSLETHAAPLALVVRPHPAITSVSLNGGSWIIKGTNGFRANTFYLRGSSSLLLPSKQWTLLASNSFAADGSFSVTNAAATGAGFYCIQY